MKLTSGSSTELVKKKNRGVGLGRQKYEKQFWCSKLSKKPFFSTKSPVSARIFHGGA